MILESVRIVTAHAGPGIGAMDAAYQACTAAQKRRALNLLLEG